MNPNFSQFIEFELIKIGEYTVTVKDVLLIFLVLFFAFITDWLIRRFLQRKYEKSDSKDEGRIYAYQKVFKYLIFFLAALVILHSLGIKISVLLTGSAALLVGIGIGLQQTFNDLISGFILLSEGSVEKGDVVHFSGVVGTVKSIGLRTSKIETRDSIVMIVPNSKLVVENVINWSHNEISNRFHVEVGVAYGSDVDKVTTILLQAALEHPMILKEPSPQVQFRNFGSSSLDFILHFYTGEFLKIEFIKSDLRYTINRLLAKNKITIPFSQHDIWIKEMPVRFDDQDEQRISKY